MVVEGLQLRRIPEPLVDQQGEGVANRRPNGERPEKADDETYVEPVARFSRSRRFHVLFLASVAAVQVVWLAALGYGLYVLVL